MMESDQPPATAGGSDKSMPYDNLNVTEDSGIVTITLDRPDKLNALVGHMRRDLAETRNPKLGTL